MIVHTLRKPRHAASRLAIGSQKAKHAFRARHQQGRIETLLQIPCQLAHLTVPALCQEALEAATIFFNFFGLGSAEIQETMRTIIDFY